MSAHKLSKFNELRDAIQISVGRVIAGVYLAQAQDYKPAPDVSHLEGGVVTQPPGAAKSPTFLYDNIIVVGHSLGSVISYDVLNHMLVDDEIARTAGHSEQILQVQERTKLLLTFGSPLDKTAFLFRIKGGTDELREAAAANWQPLIRVWQHRFTSAPQER